MPYPDGTGLVGAPETAAQPQHPHVLSHSSTFGALAEATPTSAELGFYVHVPFCRTRCYYCSFNPAPLGDRASVERDVRSAGTGIELLRAAPLNGRRPEIATVFLGGGTPSLLEPDEVAGILDATRDGFAVAADVEITVECNPESVTRDKLVAYRAAGVNRVSLGVQSLDDSILPVLDGAGWRRGLAGVLDWQPDHLSAYGLTLDAGSLWGATGAPRVPAEETTVAQYRGLCDAAGARGFEHYEISNWARPGSRSRHNQIYWRRGEYLAAGPGGCGFIGNVRYGNTKPLARYCALVEERRLPIDTSERLTERQALGERLILGLRTVDGVPATDLVLRTADDATLARRVETWRERGLLRVD